MKKITKKATTKATRKGSAKKSKLTERAEHIINSGVYSNDTRVAIKNALTYKDDDLAELVRRAEQGEDILDCTEEAAVRRRAERIINSTEQSKTNRALVEIALEQNFDNLADFVAAAERGEILDAIKTERQDPQRTDVPPAATDDRPEGMSEKDVRALARRIILRQPSESKPSGRALVAAMTFMRDARSGDRFDFFNFFMAELAPFLDGYEEVLSEANRKGLAEEEED